MAAESALVASNAAAVVTAQAAAGANDAQSLAKTRVDEAVRQQTAVEATWANSVKTASGIIGPESAKVAVDLAASNVETAKAAAAAADKTGFLGCYDLL